MQPMKHYQRVLAGIGLAVFIILGYFFFGIPSVDPKTAYGVTWSATYSKELGIDSQKGLEAALDDLGVRRFRIPSYWNLIEAEKGKKDFSILQNQLDAIAGRGGKAIVVVGATQPRWPECWLPTWAQGLTAADREQAQMDYVRETVRHFAGHPALESWQVENELSLFSFGLCKDQRKEFVIDEMKNVRTIDAEIAKGKNPHPIYTADSGELSTWLGFAPYVDGKGVSTYRLVREPGGKVIRYFFLPPFIYFRHALLVRPWIKTIFVSEFQMEPWELAPLSILPLEEQMKTFDLNQMKNSFHFAERMRMPSVYFWGAEWWYWMKEVKQQPAFWDEAKTFLTNHAR